MTGRSGLVIFVVGMMGSGKTTVGRHLADQLDAVFIDLDAEIEERSGLTVAQWFERGESTFRTVERDTLEAVCMQTDDETLVVVATGGGTVNDEQTRARIRRVGRTVYLAVSPAVLASRLAPRVQREQRPLLAGVDDVEAVLARILDERKSAYESCEVQVDATGPVEEICSRIRVALGVDDGS